jgi:hypothetical protein
MDDYRFRSVLSLITEVAVKPFASTRSRLLRVIVAALPAPLPEKDEDGGDADDEQKAHQDKYEEKLSGRRAHRGAASLMIRLNLAGADRRPALTTTLSKVERHDAELLWLVTARPMKTSLVMLSVRLGPICTQFRPSLEVCAVKRFPLRIS